MVNALELMKSLTYPKDVRKNLMNKELYWVTIMTPSYSDGYHILSTLLVETRKSCEYVQEYLTKKKIPVCYEHIYEYKNRNLDLRNRKINYKTQLIGPYSYPYFIFYDICKQDTEHVVDGHYNLFGYGIGIPPSIKVESDYDYQPYWQKAKSDEIEAYCNQHKDIETFAAELDTLFSECIDHYLYKEWPQQNLYNDNYQCQRETAKQIILKKLNKKQVYLKK